MADPRVGAADTHARLRWLGVVSFCLGAGLFLVTLAAALTGRAGFARLLVPFVTMGLSLGSFGTNNDTFLHTLADLAREKALPERHRAEWEHEHRVRPARMKSLHAAPKVAKILPFVALLLLAFAGWRAAQAWGLV